MQTTLPPFRWYIHRHLLDDSVWACPDAILHGCLAWMRDLSLLTMNYRVPLAEKLRPRSRLSALMLYGVTDYIRFSQRTINFKGHIVSRTFYRSFMVPILFIWWCHQVCYVTWNQNGIPQQKSRRWIYNARTISRCFDLRWREMYILENIFILRQRVISLQIRRLPRRETYADRHVRVRWLEYFSFN